MMFSKIFAKHSNKCNVAAVMRTAMMRDNEDVYWRPITTIIISMVRRCRGGGGTITKPLHERDAATIDGRR